ncbi:hypothetical protein RCH12_002724 [Cryobacterium sp. MP_3.1]|nr:hypothetical protein [Cryobacterium sp. MP_3.1]
MNTTNNSSSNHFTVANFGSAQTRVAFALAQLKARA